MSKLSRIFYIYTEAHVALLMSIFAALELVCFIFTDSSIAYVFLSAAIAFTAIAASSVMYIIYQENKYTR